MGTPEILAPAGNQEALLAAIRCGANAVYVGAKAYSARSSAENFDSEGLREAVALCHLSRVKLHLAVNTLLMDKEMNDFRKFIEDVAKMGVDACIVQDIGVLWLIHETIPEMPLHASTQMSIHTVEGAMQAKELGCSRIVAARELNREELRKLCNLPIETEVFVHGALCMSVSGQCSFSSVVGRRSANRGQCAQACRLPWKTPAGKNSAALSLKDVSLVEHVQELKEMGVDSFKIEGRMKRPEYVAAAVTALKLALQGEKPDMEMLQAVFSRNGFTDGYFTGKKKNMFGYRRKEDVLAGQKLFPEIQKSYQKEKAIAGVNFSLKLNAGKPAEMTISDTEENTAVVYGAIPEKAEKTPLEVSMLKRSMQKLGGSIYFCQNVELENTDELILTSAQCNALRREAVEKLNAERIRKYTPEYVIKEIFPEIPVKKNLHSVYQNRLHIQNIAQLKGISEEIICLSVNLAENCPPEKSFYVEAPRMIHHEEEYIQKLEKLFTKGWKHLLCHNPADVRIGKRIGYILHGGFGLNCTNFISAETWLKEGLQDVTLSYELSSGIIKRMSEIIPCGAFVYGKLPMMLFRICPIKAQDGCRKKNCFLTDRTGRKFPLSCHQEEDYWEMLNAEILWISDKLADFSELSYRDFYFTEETPEQMKKILFAYATNSAHVPEKRTKGLYDKGGLN